MILGKYGFVGSCLMMVMLVHGEQEDGNFEQWSSEVSKQWSNKFVKYHDYISQVRNLSNCWICTHAPIAAKTMPYFVTPLSEKELFTQRCWEMRPLDLSDKQSKTSAALPITGWTKAPWLQVNLTSRTSTDTVSKNKDMYEFRQHDGVWSDERTNKNYLGRIPSQNLKVSFQAKPITPLPLIIHGSQYCNKQVCIKNELHTKNWTYAFRFVPGNSETCADRGAVHLDPETAEGQLGDGSSEMSISGGKPECMPIRFYRSVTTDLEDSWCLYTETTSLVSIVIALITEYQFQLPKGVYIVCGENAYRWIPHGALGTCTLARLEPATWVWEDKDFPFENIPQHMLAKRDVQTHQSHHNEHLMQTPWFVKAGMVLTGPLGTAFGTLRNAQKIEELGDIFDNVTDLLFDALDVESAYMKQIIVIVNQHSLVLDYLTASQGGFCQVVGPACCHYINPSGLMQVTHDIYQAERLKDEFKKINSFDFPLPSWLSWLNPLNIFKGIGGWIIGIIQYLIQGVFLILVIVIIIKLFILIIKRISKAKCNCFSGRYKTRDTAKQSTAEHPKAQVLTMITTAKARCVLCDKETLVDLADCVHCGNKLV